MFRKPGLRIKRKKWQKKLVTIPNYHLIYDDSLTSAGGVAIYAKQDIFKIEFRKDLKLEVPKCESIFLEIEVSNESSEHVKTLLVGSVYRHPSKSNTTLFTDEFCNTLEKYTNRNIPVVILGDINFDVSKASSDSVQHYHNALSSIGCSNIIKIYTRFGRSKKGISRSILDHIITNIDEDKVVGGVINYPITDHLPIFIILKKQITPTDEKKDEAMWRFIDE